jgi:anti-sigma regulatory factor (Ser/Thr protein kinase)
MPGVRGDGARIMTAAAIIRPRRRVFPGSGDQVGRARQFVGQVLGGCPAADDAVLLTSELVTNAITHTASGRGGKIVVTIYRADTRVRVEVRDGGSDRVPAVRSAGTAEVSGYGLGLVELIARCWGYRGGQRGRIVWFMLEWKPNP